MAAKYGFFILILVSCVLAKKKTTTAPPELILPAQCSWSKTIIGTIECYGDVPDFSSYDPLQLAPITGLVITGCTFGMVSRGNLENLANLTNLAIDCTETVVQDGAFNGLNNLTWLSIGKGVGVLSKNLLCHLKALKTLYLDNNFIGAETDFGLLTNCSSFLVPILCATNITKLSVSYNLLTSIKKDGFLCALNAITELNLTKNAISTIESGSLANVPSLRRLYLGYNALTELTLDTFDSVVNLTYLDLSYNRLTTLPIGVFKSLTKLHFLNLRGNGFTSFTAPVFAGLTLLSELDLTNNQLTDISWVLTPLTQLARLHLGGNKIEKITSSTFAGLAELNYINLERNAIGSVADDALAFNPRLSVISFSNNKLEKVPNLSYNKLVLVVYLDHNEITEINPTDFAAAPLILLLYLNNNKLTSIGPNAFTSFVHLLRLDLSDNKLTTLDNGTFANLAALKYLALQGNQLSFKDNIIEDVNGKLQMDLFTPLKSLLLLNISDNEIEQFEYSWFPLSLIYLSLADNEIRHLPTYSLPYTPHLHTLDLSNNLIENLTENQFPPSLTHVILNSNSIRHVNPDTFEDLNNLESVNLRSNSLESLAKLNLGSPTITLFLRDNPWLCDCRLSWMKAWNAPPMIYDALLMKCSFLFNHTADDEAPKSFLQSDIGNFLCAYKKDAVSSMYGQSLIEVRKSVSRCFGPTCAQQMKCPDECLCYHNLDWTTVKVVCVEAGLEQVPEESPDATDVVYLNHNPITSIEKTTFKNYDGLKDLYIRNGKLTTVTDGSFTYVKEIEKIYLDHNQIDSLQQGTFQGLEKVIDIDLSFNKLASLPPDSFQGLAALKRLNLQNNMLTNFPVWNLKSLPGLSTVGLANNPWTCNCSFMFSYNDYQKANYDKIQNITQLYCKPEVPADQSTATAYPNNTKIPMAVFDMTQCFHTRLMAEVVDVEQPTSSHGVIVAVSVMVIVVAMVAGILAVLYRRELRFAIEKKFGRRLL